MPRTQNGLRGSTQILRVSQPEFYSRILSLTLCFWFSGPLLPFHALRLLCRVIPKLVHAPHLAPLHLEDLSSLTPVPVFTNQEPARPHRVASRVPLELGVLPFAARSQATTLSLSLGPSASPRSLLATPALKGIVAPTARD